MNAIKLSVEQEYAFEKFKQGENLFVTGPGGTGKTKLIEHLVSYCNKIGKKVQVTAMTGCATSLLPPSCHARTFNSYTGIKLARGDKQKIIDSVLRKKSNRKNYKTIQVLIVDEVSMMSKKVFEIVNEIAKTARLNENPFGGLQVVFTGDFLQLPPVPNADEKDTHKFCFESTSWEKVFPYKNNIELRTMFRQKDPVYQSILLEIRKGTISEENTRILQEYVRPSNEESTISKLYPLKWKTDNHNASEYSKLVSHEHVFSCIRQSKCTTNLESNKPLSVEDMVKCENMNEQEKQYELNSLVNTSNFTEELCLKKGCVVMCTSNIDLERGLCNGSQGIVVGFSQEVEGIQPKPIVKYTNGMTRVMEPIFRQSEEYPSLAVGQIPLVLAWAMTIHKIQGATLDAAHMDIGQSIFECGQTYVALSRIKSLEGLYLSAFQPHNIRANVRAIAFYKELDVIDYEKELAILREETKGLKKADHMDSPVKNSDESSTKTLSMDPFLSFRYEEPNIEKAKKVYINNSPKKKESTADKTWALYLEHFDLQKIATIRGLKKNTILEHMITKLPDDRIRIEDMIDMDIYNEIKKVYDIMGNEPLHVIKQQVRWSIGYNELKIVRNSMFGGSREDIEKRDVKQIDI